MSHQDIITFLKGKNKRINVEGIIEDTSWYFPMIQFVILILMGVMYYIYTFYKRILPITLHATTLYSNFIEQLLILNKLPYRKIYKPYLDDIAYYKSSKKKTISINPKVKDFINETIEFIPLSEDELEVLSDHLNLDVKPIQEQVLSLMPEINGYHIIRGNYLDDEVYNMNHYKIKKIIKIHDYLYKVITNEETFYTNLILSDETLALQIGDVLNGMYYCTTDEQVYTENKYVVNQFNTLSSLSKGLKKDIVHLPFYTMDVPRQGLICHPFHLPKSKDPILSLLIMVQVLIT